MKAKKIFSGMIENNKLILDNKSGLLDYIKVLGGGKPEQRVNLTIEKFRKKRSNNQNDYYWGVVVDILGNELGYTPDEMNEAIKMKFLLIEGEVLDTMKSTKDLNTVEFEDLMERIRIWASKDLNIYIPNPNEADY